MTDEDTIECICENPYYQYFLGYHSFTDKQVFTPSLFVAIRNRLGYYPESINADKIYWTRKNRAYCKRKRINLYGGSPLGRPPKIGKSPAEKRKIKKEAGKGNRIEGVFGNSKRRFGLDLVMTKTVRTSENWIAMVIFVMNMLKMVKDNFLSKFLLCYIMVCHQKIEQFSFKQSYLRTV